MNNPFLSDRNIFSKVVNPLKKKSETDKKQQVKPTPLPQKYKESKVQPYNNQYKYQKPIEYKSEKPTQPIAKTIPPFLNNQKMSFGAPQVDEWQQPDRKYLGSRQGEQDSQNSSQIDEIYNYKKNQSIKFPQTKQIVQNDKYKPNSARPIQILTPTEQVKFEQFRKKNNLNDYSPINPPQKSNDSQFFNLDALGDDLNKFLAESKNQQELCKILGIQTVQRTNRKQEKKEREILDSNKYQSKNAPSSKAYNPYNSGEFNDGFRGSIQEEAPKVPAVFSKERKVQIGKAQNVSYKPQQVEKNDYIPTFNYVGLDLQNSTTSRHQEEIDRMTALTPKDKKFQTSKANKGFQGIDDLQVFNYSKGQTVKKPDSLQQKIAKQMSDLSINGKYRTFLSASQKVIAYKYTMQVL